VSTIFIKKADVFHVDDEGHAGKATVDVSFDPEIGQFVVVAPEHIFGGELLTASTLHEVIEKYEAACDTYSRERLRPDLTPMLSIYMMGAKDVRVKSLGTDASVLLGYMEVFQAGDQKVYRRDGKTIGPRMGDNCRLLPDTEEVRAKLDSLIASIRTADDILQGLNDAPDRLQYLMSISNDWVVQTPDEPVMHALSVDLAAVNEAFADIATKIVDTAVVTVEDDDEL
jgi:hypothetical protein